MAHSMERLLGILKTINERGFVRVTELSKLFQVTEATIRSDLAKLEADRKIIRNHGGAASLTAMGQTAFASMPGADAALTANQEDNVALVPERMNVRREEKMRIAQAALELIEPHDRIIMDASSTTFYLAQLIPSDLPITVLTHSVSIIVELNKKQKTEVIATGGILSKNTMSFIGPLSESTMGMYNVNKAFISCMGVHLEYGVTELSELQALVKRKMIEAADHVILLADHSKFGRKNFTHLCNFDQIDLIITDDQVDRQHLSSMESSGIRYRVAT